MQNMEFTVTNLKVTANLFLDSNLNKLDDDLIESKISATIFIDTIQKSTLISSFGTRIHHLLVDTFELKTLNLQLDIDAVNFFFGKNDSTEASIDQSIYFSTYEEDKFTIPQISQIIDQQLGVHSKALIIYTTSSIVVQVDWSFIASVNRVFQLVHIAIWFEANENRFLLNY